MCSFCLTITHATPNEQLVAVEHLVHSYDVHSLNVFVGIPDIPYGAELNASAQRNFGRPQTVLVSTLNGTLHNTIGRKLIWDCPINANASHPLFKAPVELVRHFGECARHILLSAPLPAFEHATILMMDAPTKKLLICVLLYLMNRPTFWRPGRNPTLRDPLSPNHRLRAQRLVCAQLPSEIDRSTQSGLERHGRGRAGLHCSLLTMLITPYHIFNRSPDGISSCNCPRKPMLLNPSMSRLEACGDTRRA